MNEIIIIDKDRKRKSAKINLTGQETAGDLLILLGLPHDDYLVEANNVILRTDEKVPTQGPIIIKPAQGQTERPQTREETITLTIKLHNARTGVNAITHTFPSSATPYDIAESLVRSVGGANPDDITIISDGSRNLLDDQFRYKTLADLGLRSGQVLTVHGDIIQGNEEWRSE
jgi:hypothetical protein